MANPAKASTVVLSQFVGPGVGVLVQTFEGVTFSGGTYMAVGTYSSVPVLEPDDSNLLALVDAMAIFATGTTPTSGAQQGSLHGLFNWSGAVSPQTFNLQPIYLVVGDGSTRESSTQFAIIDLEILFPADISAAEATSKTISYITQINTLAGTEIDSPAGSKDIIRLVPEPSVSLLAIFGGFAFLRRRRRE